MTMLEKIKKLFRLNNKKTTIKKPVNKYYIGNSNGKIVSFRGTYGTEVVKQGNNYTEKENKLFINLGVQKMENSDLKGENLYECILDYTHSGAPHMGDITLPTSLKPLQGFLNGRNICVVAQFDLERMKQDESYAEFVLIKLFDQERIKMLHELTFERNELSYGNYIGSIKDENNELSIFIDDAVGQKIGAQSMAKLKENYNIAAQKVEQCINEERKRELERLRQNKKQLEQQLEDTIVETETVEQSITSSDNTLYEDDVINHSSHK